MTDAATPTPPAKIDPESLVLRAAPGRVTRFRRGAIVAIAALGSTAIIGIAWLALQPATLSLVASTRDRPVAAKSPSEAIAGAPAGYGDVPELGPALPGDLGRPILEHRRETGSAEGYDDAARRAQEADAERQRREAEDRAAKASGVMVQIASRAAAASSVSAKTVSDASSSGQGGEIAVPDEPAGNNDGAERDRAGADTNPHALTGPASPWTLQAGSIIAASLITGIDSDLPGLVTAQVTENVYDSVTGRTLLIPQGARLVGSYDSRVAFGQSRAMVAWQRIILPDGSSIRIDDMPATDTQGYAGLSDRVDRHMGRLLEGVALSTLLGVGTEIRFGTESDLVRAIRESAQQGGTRAGDRLVSRNLDIQPTLRVRPGWPLRIVVHKDILLRPWPGGTARW